MEKQLFDWDEVDILDDSRFKFYTITLIKNIKNYPSGTCFDEAIIDYENGDLIFINYDPELEASFKLELKVV